MLPSNFDYIDSIVERYEKERDISYEVIDKLDSLPKSTKDTIFKQAYSPYCSKKELDKNLKSIYWLEVYKQSNFASILSSKARDEIYSQFSKDSKHDLPDITYENIYSTVQSWSHDGYRLFAEKIDTAFQKLSGDHVTNKPYGFTKKIIYKNLVDSFWSSSGFGSYSFKSYGIDIIHDIRTAIQTLFKMPISERYDTQTVLSCISERNVYTDIDGGAFKIKIFNNGNAHIEFNPYVALILNQELAKIYPNAIPDKHRTVTKDIKVFTFDYTMISEKTKNNLRDVFKYSNVIINNNLYTYKSKSYNYITDEVKNILEFVGCHSFDYIKNSFSCNYDITEVIRFIITNGIVDYKTNQYYPTPKNIVNIMKEYIGDIDSLKILEPSAGMGNIAELFNNGNLDCIEKEQLNYIILKNKGLNVINGDFLLYNVIDKYDLIVMNPPYSNKQWKYHIEHALNAVKQTGSIYAILPSGKASSDFKNAVVKELEVFKDEFDNTSISTSLYKINKL